MSMAGLDEAFVAAVLAGLGTFLTLFATGSGTLVLARKRRVDLTERLKRREGGNGRGHRV